MVLFDDLCGDLVTAAKGDLFDLSVNKLYQAYCDIFYIGFRKTDDV